MSTFTNQLFKGMEEYDTDLDDEETDEKKECEFPRLSFDDKLAAHRSNRYQQTFGQKSFPYRSRRESDSNNVTLLPIPSKTLPSKGRVQVYENSCQLLDTTVDWQLRALLSYDDITIMNRSLSFNDIRAVSTAMEINLQSLTLSSAGLTSRSINVLCQGLAKCNRLTLLDLSCNKLSKESFELLVDRINNLSLLNCLSLAECGIRDSYGRCIGDLCRHPTLTEINLTGNEFEEMACIFIGNALTENDALTYLNIGWNLIRSFAAIALFRGFEANRTIVDFDISWSNLSYDGSVALRRVLSVNKVLQRLDISNCNINWTCAKLIGEGLQKNSTLDSLNLSFNPLTTHGVQHIIQSLNNSQSALSTLDISGVAVFSETLRLAERIASRRNFTVKYDYEVLVHDIIGRQTVTKADSVRKVIQHIDERRWRPMDYFRLLYSKRKVQAQNEAQSLNFTKIDKKKTAVREERTSDPLVKPLTLKNLNDVIHRQRLRDRLQKAQQEQQERDLKRRNQKILQTVNQHFPDIDLVKRKQKLKRIVERLSKPQIPQEEQQ
ncbi:unnamed protein product [Adineta ricciae]|uniref:Uncharacterized protein n=1 Tax=Adineta ricciae TaxID=249248 RepID=A0A814QWZ2_ADIRI|nr:unnamed protein product [Adineta ricciae]CAF1124858.1 unnamed protein product [Adineta ricciae]